MIDIPQYFFEDRQRNIRSSAWQLRVKYHLSHSTDLWAIGRITFSLITNWYGWCISCLEYIWIWYFFMFLISICFPVNISILLAFEWLGLLHKGLYSVAHAMSSGESLSFHGYVYHAFPALCFWHVKLIDRIENGNTITSGPNDAIWWSQSSSSGYGRRVSTICDACDFCNNINEYIFVFRKLHYTQQGLNSVSNLTCNPYIFRDRVILQNSPSPITILFSVLWACRKSSINQQTVREGITGIQLVAYISGWKYIQPHEWDNSRWYWC